MWRDLWAYRKRTVLGAAGVLAGLLAVAVIAAAVSGGSGGHPDAGATPSLPVPSASTGGPSAAVPGPRASGYDRAAWSAAPSVTSATSTAYPSIPAADRTQPDVFATAFARELLIRDYRHTTRDELLAWAQACSAPLTIVQVPMTPADRATTLVTSLVTPGWDTGESGTPVGTAAAWLAARSRQAHATVSGVRVQSVPDFPPPKTSFTQATFDRLVTATVTLHSTVSGKPVATQASVAFEVVMTDQAGRLGASEVQHWVTRRLS